VPLFEDLKLRKEEEKRMEENELTTYTWLVSCDIVIYDGSVATWQPELSQTQSFLPVAIKLPFIE